MNTRVYTFPCLSVYQIWAIGWYTSWLYRQLWSMPVCVQYVYMNTRVYTFPCLTVYIRFGLLVGIPPDSIDSCEAHPCVFITFIWTHVHTSFPVSLHLYQEFFLIFNFLFVFFNKHARVSYVGIVSFGNYLNAVSPVLHSLRQPQPLHPLIPQVMIN